MYRVFYTILFYFVDYGIPLSQIKIVLFNLCLDTLTEYIPEPAPENSENKLFITIIVNIQLSKER
jgi:hypothetical protein